MSAAKNVEKKWELTGGWAGAWKIFAGIGAVGLAGAAYGFFAGSPEDHKRAAFSWLFAFITFLLIALGAIFFVLVQHLTSAGWSVTVRRTAELFGNGILVLIPLFIPIWLNANTLFPWLGHAHAEEHGGGAQHHGALQIVTPAYAQQPDQPGHAAPAGTPPDDGVVTSPPNAADHAPDPAGKPPQHELPPTGGIVPRGGPEHASNRAAPHYYVPPGAKDPHALVHEELMKGKSGYLNRTFFLIRAGIYFLIWIVLGVRLLGYSTAQDKTKDPNLTLAAQRFAPPATFLFALSLTFACFDWVMSLEPTWFSTIFGVVMFACGVVSSYAVIILVTMALRSSGPLEGAVTVEHYHDLGKLMFGFLVFWAYVSFSQFMLIWYAALPEETTFFHNRWDYAPWANVSYALILFHFVVPFFWLISRTFKRNLGRLQIGAAILLVMHVVDIYWYVMPNFKLKQDGFAFHWLDIACLLAVGGIYAAFVFYRMTQFSLVPVGDPRLKRSLAFQNA